MIKIKKLPSGSYNARVYDYKDADGKLHYKSITANSVKEVEYLAAQFKREKDRLSHVEDITLVEAGNRYICDNETLLSPSTLQGYGKIVKLYLPQFSPTNLSQITQNDLQHHLSIDATKYSPKTLRNVYGFILTLMKTYLPERRYVLKYPPKKKQITELPPPEAIYAAVKDTPVELPVMLAMWLSLRMSEIRGLRQSDISDGYLIVRNTMLDIGGDSVFRENTKTYGSTRRIRLPPYLADLISKTDTEFIVPATAPSITARFRRLLKSNNLPHTRFHDLRHINASVMLALGVPDKYAMERGGWSSDGTLKSVYQHTYTAERKATDDKIDNYFSRIVNMK